MSQTTNRKVDNTTPVPPKHKLEPSFQPSPELSIKFNDKDFHIWKEQSHFYNSVDIYIQRAYLSYCGTTDFCSKPHFAQAATIEVSIEIIKKDLTQKNPKVMVIKVSLVKVEKYSEMCIRTMILQKGADINAIPPDELIGQLILVACQDKNLLCEMMRVESTTETKLNEIIVKI